MSRATNNIQIEPLAEPKNLTRLVSKYKLNPTQAKFASTYLTNGYNALQAALSAGYSKNGIEVASNRTLRNVKVRALIDEVLGNCTDVSIDEIRKELKDLAFGSKRDHIKIKALELLAKHKQMLADNAIQANVVIRVHNAAKKGKIEQKQ